MFTRFFRGKKSNAKSQAPKLRKLRMENLEDRALLSVTPVEGAESICDEAAIVATLEEAEEKSAIDLSGAFETASTSILAMAAASTSTLTVTTNLDVVDANDGVLSLREAISQADAGSTIKFDASLKGETIALSGTELTISKGIIVDASALYTASTQTPGITVNANQNSRVFNVSGGTASNPVAFVGLKITGGKTSDDGGGVYVSSGSATFTNSTISGNTASDDGGGVYVYSSGSATFTNSTISGNTADYGGGVFVSFSGSAMFTNS
ncbi:MAG: hypothetical protein IJO40_10770, partial [Thermoguttaceae bacterium]|nr:hypothetical protein [Thermoguttaceae bacterium]